MAVKKPASNIAAAVANVTKAAAATLPVAGPVTPAQSADKGAFVQSQVGNATGGAGVLPNPNATGPYSGDPAPAAPSGPSQADIDAANAAAALLAQRQDATAALASKFRQWGIDVDGSGLAGTIWDWVVSGYSDERIGTEVRTTKGYNDRFTGMADLIKRGQGMDEATYIKQEAGYRQTMQSWNLPTGFWDDYGDYGRLMANNVSVKELDDRIASAKTFLDDQAPAAYKAALRDIGVDESGLLAYVLDGDRATSVVNKQIKTAAFQGASDMQGFGLDAASAAKYGGTLGAQFDRFGTDQRIALEQTLGKLGVQARNDQRLATIDKEQFSLSDTLDAELMSDTTKQLQSQKRALREKSRFDGSSAITTGSLSRKGGV